MIVIENPAIQILFFIIAGILIGISLYGTTGLLATAFEFDSNRKSQQDRRGYERSSRFAVADGDDAALMDLVTALPLHRNRYQIRGGGRLLNASTCHYLFQQGEKNVPDRGVFTSPGFRDLSHLSDSQYYRTSGTLQMLYQALTSAQHQRSRYSQQQPTSSAYYRDRDRQNNNGYYLEELHQLPVQCRYTFVPKPGHYVNIRFPVLNVSIVPYDMSCPETACLTLYDGKRAWNFANDSSLPREARIGGFNSSSTTVIILHLTVHSPRQRQRMLGHGFKGIYSFQPGTAPNAAAAVCEIASAIVTLYLCCTMATITMLFNF